MLAPVWSARAHADDVRRDAYRLVWVRGERTETVADLTAQMRAANDITRWTAARLEAFTSDGDLPSELGVEPHEIVRATRAAKGDGLYVLRRPAA
jgi:hypothetical protein